MIYHGCLFKESGNTSQINITANNLTIDGKTTLNNDFKVGNIDYNQIKYLEGLRQNVQATFEIIDERLKK